MNETRFETTAPIRAGHFVNDEPEFVRIPDLQRRAGIKRGLCYRRIKDGTFKSVLLREPGNKQGVRLIYWPSVKAHLLRLMDEQHAPSPQHEEKASAE
ncbi:MAG: hypothetical protein HYY24_07605 [Verrucomicrobia bacterium]|nr:hypothetical protein [Verrucomicrobiota bacterium]